METLDLNTTITLTSLEQFYKEIKEGVQLDELLTNFNSAVESQDLIKTEVSKAYTVADIKKMIYLQPGTKKEEAVKKYYEALIGGFNVVTDFVSYSPFTGTGGMITGNQTYKKNAFIEALSKIVFSTTQDNIDKNAEKIKAQRAERRQILTDPQTLEQFKLFIECRGKGSLSSEQLEKYEKLVADKILKDRAIEHEKRAVVEAVKVDSEMSITETIHTQKGHAVFVVKLADRVERSVFDDLNSKAKKLGGYYSSYARGGAVAGFQFKDRESAEKFTGLKETNQITSKYADRQEERGERKINRFLEMAESLETKGREKLNEERLSNTVRRARMAASAEAEAEKSIYWAKVLRNIATKLDNNELIYLSKISSFTQLQELKTILSQAFNRRVIAQNIRYDLRDDEKAKHELNVKYVKYPYPSFCKDSLAIACKDIQNQAGLKLVVARLLKDIKRSQTGVITFTHLTDISDLRIVAERAMGFARERVKRELEPYDRLQRMGLTTIEILKMALRELVECMDVKTLSPEEVQLKKIKELERQFVGAKIEGFFPTPANVAEGLVKLAGIENTDLILEPSAGLGHVVDKINELHPENTIHCIEINYSLSQVLQAKDFDVVASDFMQFNGYYDKIIMNPPFENGQDIDHVKHAFNCLKDNGRLVAIMSEGPFFRADKKASEFRSWLELVGGYSEKLPDGSFESSFRPTGVNTRVVVIDKL